MDAIIAYYPSYIWRQYELTATFPATFVPQPLPVMSGKFLFAYRNKWARCLKQGPEPTFSMHLPDGYVDYLEVEASKVRKRIEEKGEERKRQKKY